MDQYTQLLYGLAGIAIAGFVSWTFKSVFTLRSEIDKLELRISQTYATNNTIQEVKDDLKSIIPVIFQIAGKLGIEIRRD